MSSSIVVVGSLNTDFVATLNRFPEAGETVAGNEFRIFCGGKGANQAYAAGKLGAQVTMIGRVGDDAHADLQIENLRSVGVDTFLITRDRDASTGTAIIAVDESRENRIIVIPGANGTFRPEHLPQAGAALSSASMVLLQLETPLDTVEAAARLAKKGNAQVILDPAPAQSLSDSLLAHVDYLTPNFSELIALTGVQIREQCDLEDIACCARQLLERGVGKVIVKMGRRGALLVTSEDMHFWPALSVVAVDTTAAGDCFNAAFAAALVSGMPEVEAGTFAVAAAALCVTRAGAQPSMPSGEEVEALVSGRVGNLKA